jgi:hypothetical protein
MTGLCVASRSTLFLGLLTSAGWAQSSPVRTLGSPDAVLDLALTTVTAVRELRDGRIILVDSRDEKVWLVSSNLSGASQIGRVGKGPGEYLLPSKAFAIRGDSTVVLDLANARLLVITGQAQPGGALDVGWGLSCTTRRPIRLQLARAADMQGHFYSQGSPVAIAPDGHVGMVDSAAIERWSEPCQRDTLAYVPNPFGVGSMLIGGNVVGPPGESKPFPASVQWAVASDGTLAIAYPAPYRVDFVGSNKRRTTGNPIEYEHVKVNEALKEEWRSAKRQPQSATVLSRGGSSVNLGDRAEPWREPSQWPEYLPPFLSEALHFGPRNLLWVQRSTVARQPATFDIIDPSGHLVYQLRLPAARRLVGFGTDAVYLVRIDENDQEFLERYRLP